MPRPLYIWRLPNNTELVILLTCLLRCGECVRCRSAAMDGRWQQVQQKHSRSAAAVSASRTAPPVTQDSAARRECQRAITPRAITPGAITPGAITPSAITSHRLGPSLYKPRSGSFSTLYRRELVFLNRLKRGGASKEVPKRHRAIAAARTPRRSAPPTSVCAKQPQRSKPLQRSRARAVKPTPTPSFERNRRAPPSLRTSSSPTASLARLTNVEIPAFSSSSRKTTKAALQIVRPATTTTRVGDAAPAAPTFVVTYVSTLGAGGVRLIYGSGAGSDVLTVWRQIAADNPGFAPPGAAFLHPHALAGWAVLFTTCEQTPALSQVLSAVKQLDAGLCVEPSLPTDATVQERVGVCVSTERNLPCSSYGTPRE
jgi:hypothetical protein